MMGRRWRERLREMERLQREMAVDLIDEAEAEEQTDFMRGYVMGACSMAGALGLPHDVWAHPEREMRRARGRA